MIGGKDSYHVPDQYPQIRRPGLLERRNERDSQVRRFMHSRRLILEQWVTACMNVHLVLSPDDMRPWCVTRIAWLVTQVFQVEHMHDPTVLHRSIIDNQRCQYDFPSISSVQCAVHCNVIPISNVRPGGTPITLTVLSPSFPSNAIHLPCSNLEQSQFYFSEPIEYVWHTAWASRQDLIGARHKINDGPECR